MRVSAAPLAGPDRRGGGCADEGGASRCGRFRPLDGAEHRFPAGILDGLECGSGE